MLEPGQEPGNAELEPPKPHIDSFAAKRAKLMVNQLINGKPKIVKQPPQNLFKRQAFVP
jgi:hypothetical protein